MNNINKILLSIVVPTFNNPGEFEDTLLSIHENCSDNTQIVIVDGGEETLSLKIIAKVLGDSFEQVTYLRDSAKGVFPAQNLGIKSCLGEWILMLNSGDLLSKNAKECLNLKYLKSFDKDNILVFCQDAYTDDKQVVDINFTPTHNSIWPHQSVLVRKTVYDRFGLYREDYKYGAEQYYFAIVRRKTSFIIINKTLSLYKLGGISSKMSFQHVREIYQVKRELGQSMFISAWYSFITPYVRIVLEKLIGNDAVNKIKRRLFKYYS